MLRALWFLCQVIVVILAAVWLIERPGDVTLEAFDYTLTIRTGLFLIGFILFAMTFSLLVRLMGALISLPSSMGMWGRKRRKAKAMRQLTQGYALLSAGQAEKALKLSVKVQDVLPEARSLALLLEAQSHRALGKQASAATAYQQLMNDKDAVFLGLKGLLSQSIETGQTEKAIDYAHKAVKMHPKTGWVVKTLYDLQIGARDFDAARQSMKKAVKLGVLTREQAVSDDIAMLMYQADKAEEAGNSEEASRYIERAAKLDPSFIPAVTALAAQLIEKGKTRRAQSLIETAWKTNPHPALVPLWDKLAPKNTARDMMKRLRWYEALVALNPDAAAGQLAAAQAALDENLTGEARGHLLRAAQSEPSKEVYRAMLALERAAHAEPAVIRAAEERLLNAPPSKVWTCTKTGAVYDRWSPIARPHGSFNTIVWGLPQVPAAQIIHANDDALDDPMMIGTL